ncbi:uncharacterized protein LOC114455233 isoform X4 [Gouania willdenowi]|uniref:uncharacterized protein LOC114455233 isoform X4 n=1 Tax=Gouania willdenowi TaxID=441366 RepID=UPI001054FDBF|nr:uncharacterized protein LOC114455233 isoform X4 [Gouania willdenowi]
MPQSRRGCFCSVPCCSCGARKHPYLSYHAFPTDPGQRRQWIQAVRREEGPNFCIKPGSTFVCSRHFTKEDFISESIISRLKSGVVPSLFPWNNFIAPPKREPACEGADKQQIGLSQQASQAVAATADHDYVAHPPTGGGTALFETGAKMAMPLESSKVEKKLCHASCQTDPVQIFPNDARVILHVKDFPPLFLKVADLQGTTHSHNYHSLDQSTQPTPTLIQDTCITTAFSQVIKSKPPTFGLEIKSEPPTFGLEIKSEPPTFGLEIKSESPTFGREIRSEPPTFGREIRSEPPTFGREIRSEPPTFGQEI